MNLKFNTYRFADYKEQVIDLLRRVPTVSVGKIEVVTLTQGLRFGTLSYMDDHPHTRSLNLDPAHPESSAN